LCSVLPLTMTELTTYDKAATTEAHEVDLADDVEVGGGERGSFSTPFKPRTGKTLEWSKLSFSAANGKKILDETWGKVEPGQVSCIMGPSGAGKSSLLNVLAGRVEAGVSGTVSLNKYKINPVAEKTRMAYVMQEDAMFPCLTPREALAMSAALRLPGTVSKEQQSELVEQLIEELGLTKCANTLIGNVMIQGLSGGEKKRTAVGVELVTCPDMIFLDEPTSGLDSYSAAQCVEILGKVCKAGAVVICTIHQPSSAIYDLFDHAILLKDGRVVFQGGSEAMYEHFQAAGHPIPQHYNPADYVMDVIQQKDLATLETAGLLMAPAFKEIEGLSEAKEENRPPPTTASFCTQLQWLGWRERLALQRDKAGTIIPFIITGFLHVVFSLIFLGVGEGNSENIVKLTSHAGAVTFITVSAMFGTSQTALLTFPFERPLFLREYANGTYGAIPYFMSKMAVELPMGFLKSMMAALIVYFAMKLQGNFLLLTTILWLMGSAASSVSLLLASSTKDVKSANELSPLVFVPQLLFAGFFIRLEQIPVYIRWAQYLCSLKYAMNLMLLNEFGHEDDLDTVKAMLDQNDVYKENWWVYLLVLLALFAGFRMGALAMLVRKARVMF